MDMGIFVNWLSQRFRRVQLAHTEMPEYVDILCISCLKNCLNVEKFQSLSGSD